jgi:hypothetical protein
VLPATLRVEMRVFLDAPRACLFAIVTHEATRQHIDLLAEAPKRMRVPRADNYAELAQRMCETINAATDPEPPSQLAA